MTVEEKLARLSPSHDHFEQVLDPWHADAFAGIPEVERLIQNEDADAPWPTRGVRRKVWYSVDWCGNLIQEWGVDAPPGHSN